MESKKIDVHNPWRLVVIGSVILVSLAQFLAFIQGFYIAIARLDYHQSLVMIKPTFLYVTPFYFLMGRWVACREPKRYFFYPFMTILISILANSIFYYFFYRIPLVFYAFNPFILLVYFSVTAFGGMVGKNTNIPDPVHS